MTGGDAHCSVRLNCEQYEKMAETFKDIEDSEYYVILILLYY